MKKNIKLSAWAKRYNYTYRGAFGLFQRGGIPNTFRTSSGSIFVEIDDGVSDKPEYNVVYTRVSSSENRSNLESQSKRVCDFCAARGWVAHEVIKECASGLNDYRPKLTKILKSRKATRIVVEHKDRLTRFGFNYIKMLLTDCEIVVINEVADCRDDLMGDFVSLVTSFCARLYGFRRNRRRTEKIIEELSHDSVV